MGLVIKKIVLLLCSGAEPNAEDCDGNTALFDATFSHGYLEIVKVLHEKGADLMHANKKNETALFWADGEGVVEYFLEHGCDPFIRNSVGMTALDMTRFSGFHASKVEVLERYIDRPGT